MAVKSPPKLVSVAQMVAVEKEANASGLSYETMMENAGRGLAEVVAENYAHLAGDGILGLVGSGNNGGDTLVALTLLARQGWAATAYLVRPRQPADPLVEEFLKAGGLIYTAWDDPQYRQMEHLVAENGVLLDGILGTGFRLPLKSEIAAPLLAAQQYVDQLEDAPVVVAVDCPSGVDCDSGEAAAETIAADLTVTMAAIKQGLFRFPANNLVGELTLVGIGLPEGGSTLSSWQSIRTIIPDANWVKNVLPARPVDAHKGSFGTALIVAGSLNYTGAAWLAGQAAYRIGAGLVTLAVPESIHAALAGQFPEATWILLPEEDGFIAAQAAEAILENLPKATALLVGPGFGLNTGTGTFLQRLFTGQPIKGMGFFGNQDYPSPTERTRIPPLVIDADGLKLLARLEGWYKLIPQDSILTPHPGETSILTGQEKSSIQANRLEIAQQSSREWGQIVVLKGAFTVIAAPDGRAAVIPVATPALARAGTGDVLAGLITGLLAQGVSAYPAAVAAAWIHANAGWHAAKHLGNSASVLAGDILKAVIQVISDELVEK